MSKCTSKGMGKLLYSYELGMLSTEERDAFEAHLLECPHCLELALEHGQVSELLREDDEIRELISELGQDPSVTMSFESEPATPSFKKRRWSVLLRPAAVAAVLIAVLILRPWNLQFQPAQDAVASDRLMAVMPFDNLVDDSDSSRIAAIATNLLTTDLSESHYLRIVSFRTVSDLYGASISSGRDSAALENVSLEVARATQATWVLTGSVVQIEPSLILTAQLVEVASEEIVMSHRVRAKQENDIFSLVDELAAKIRNDLLVPLGAEDLYDPAVADVTTSSAQAYRYYLEGLEYLDKLFFDEAQRSWEKALEFDSAFAMCYFYLAQLVDRTLIAKAAEYSEQASRRERLHILSLEARVGNDMVLSERYLQDVVDLFPEDVLGWTMLAETALLQGRNSDAITYFEEALKVDPAHKRAYAFLAYLFQTIGDVEQALRTVDTYTEMVPREPNPYDTRADILAQDGRLEEAIANYQKVRSIKPDFGGYSTLLELGRLYKYRQEYEKAGECFQEAATNGGSHVRSSARTEMALIPLHQGRLQETWSVLADGFAADRMDQASARGHGPGEKNHFVAGLVHLAIGAYDQAAEEFAVTIDIAKATNPGDSVRYRTIYAFALAGGGHYAAADTITKPLRHYIEEADLGLDPYWVARGWVNIAMGNYQAALDTLEQVSSDRVRAGFAYKFWRARAYLETGRYADAATQLSSVLSNYADEFRSLMAIWDVQAHYFLAQAYEQSGQSDKAIEQYETFVHIWRNADPALQTMVTDARNRLTRLRSTP